MVDDGEGGNKGGRERVKGEQMGRHAVAMLKRFFILYSFR